MGVGESAFGIDFGMECTWFLVFVFFCVCVATQRSLKRSEVSCAATAELCACVCVLYRQFVINFPYEFVFETLLFAVCLVQGNELEMRRVLKREISGRDGLVQGNES